MPLGRAELELVLEVLWHKKKELETLGPHTDYPELARRKVQAIEKATTDLTRTHFSINPFV